jgi:hypothetical protein
MPDAEAMPFWSSGSEAETEDLAAWLRDVGGDGISDEPFDPSIDASWLGAAPTSDELTPGAARPAPVLETEGLLGLPAEPVTEAVVEAVAEVAAETVAEATVQPADQEDDGIEGEDRSLGDAAGAGA